MEVLLCHQMSPFNLIRVQNEFIVGFIRRATSIFDSKLKVMLDVINLRHRLHYSSEPTVITRRHLIGNISFVLSYARWYRHTELQPSKIEVVAFRCNAFKYKRVIML